ncbi:uncharacterized protein LOC127477909 [Manacus candei]|uniref:uncharacterized protein LOC127477909 n=1 Tax=Manacus candei TaxID=415023 RepID=UPI002227574A|nr:uncharacterized protein LOC127477909 [Manacus candei]
MRAAAGGQSRGRRGGLGSGQLLPAPCNAHPHGSASGQHRLPAAAGPGGRAAANGSRGAAHVRAGPGRPRPPLAPHAAAALRWPRAPRPQGRGERGASPRAGTPGGVRGAQRERQRLVAKPGVCFRCAALEGTRKSKAVLARAGGGTAGIAGTDSSPAAPEAEHSGLRKKPN